MKIFWFTGQPSHGKTILAKLLVDYLKFMGKSYVFHVDGDNLRELITNKDYSKQGRINNVNITQKIAHYLHNEGNIVVVSLVSPYRDQREEFKAILKDKIIEFYVNTTEPRERDHFRVDDYEPPLKNFVNIDTTQDTPHQSFLKILQKCQTEII